MKVQDVVTNRTAEDLVLAIRAVVQGQSYLGAEVATAAVRACQEERTCQPNLNED